LCDRYPRLKAIVLSCNFGKEIAVAAGNSYSKSDATIVMDSDLQHPPELIQRWVMFKTVAFGDPVQGDPTLLVVVLFFSGIQLITLGVIGEYRGRVYEEVKARPLFLVREELGFQSPPAPVASPAAVASTKSQDGPAHA
jgi:hypothetical protein